MQSCLNLVGGAPHPDTGGAVERRQFACNERASVFADATLGTDSLWQAAVELGFRQDSGGFGRIQNAWFTPMARP